MLSLRVGDGLSSLPDGFEVDMKAMHSQGEALKCKHVAWSERATHACAGGQDSLLWDMVFKASPRYGTGFFVEFGSRDGVSHSNTFFFETQLAWRGILAEAMPHELGDVARSRPASAAIIGGICERDGPVQFSASTLGGWSGRRDAYDVARNGSGFGEATSVPCFSLSTLLPAFGIRHVDFMSVDTEGSELQALMGFPWDSVSVDVVGVEVLTGDDRRAAKERDIVQFMAGHRFKVLHELQFAQDTKDVFFVPLPVATMRGAHSVAGGRRSNDIRKFENTRRECRMFQRCAV